MSIGRLNFGLTKSYRRFFSNKIVYGNEVRLAKKNNIPIVALESTIITHGMPYPDNFNTAIKVEALIRQQVCLIIMFIFKFNRLFYSNVKFLVFREQYQQQ